METTTIIILVIIFLGCLHIHSSYKLPAPLKTIMWVVAGIIGHILYFYFKKN